MGSPVDLEVCSGPVKRSRLNEKAEAPQGISRVFGWVLAPSNPWKLAAVLTAPLLLILVVLIAMLLGWQQRSLAEIQEVGLKQVGRAFFEHLKATRIWTSGHGGFYVEAPPSPVAPGLGPDVNDINIMGRTYRRVGRKTLTPEIRDLAERQGLYTFHVTSLRPSISQSIPDAWEAEELQAFARGERVEATTIVTRGERQFFRYIAPLVLEESCLRCHRRGAFGPSSVRGGLTVDVPMTASDNEYARLVKTSAVRFGLLGLVAVVAVILITVFVAHRISEGFLAKLRQEAALRNLNELLSEISVRDRKILESIHDGIAVIDADGVVEMVNPFLLRFDSLAEPDVVGRRIMDLPQDSTLHRILSIGEAGQGDVVGASGEDSWELPIGDKTYTASRIVVSDEKTGEFFCELRILHDVTREKLSAALELAGTAAHNLRQPLAVILNLKELIATRAAADEEIEEELAILEEQCYRLDDILKKMLRITTYRQKVYLDDLKILELDDEAARPGGPGPVA